MTPQALNYAAAATFDDGTCVASVPGCANPLATNYDAAVTLRDDSLALTLTLTLTLSLALTLTLTLTLTR